MSKFLKQQLVSKLLALIPLLIFIGMCIYGLIIWLYPESFIDRGPNKVSPVYNK